MQSHWFRWGPTKSCAFRISVLLRRAAFEAWEILHVCTDSRKQKDCETGVSCGKNKVYQLTSNNMVQSLFPLSSWLNYRSYECSVSEPISPHPADHHVSRSQSNVHGRHKPSSSLSLSTYAFCNIVLSFCKSSCLLKSWRLPGMVASWQSQVWWLNTGLLLVRSRTVPSY